MNACSTVGHPNGDSQSIQGLAGNTEKNKQSSSTDLNLKDNPQKSGQEKQSGKHYTENHELTNKLSKNKIDSSRQETPEEIEPEIREVPIPEDSVFPLLTAEFALRKRNFDYALSVLLEQSIKLDDPDLTRRTLQLATLRNRDDAILALAVRLTKQDPNDAMAAVIAMAQLIRTHDIERALDFAREAKRRGARINVRALLVNFDALSAKQQRTITIAIEALARDWPQDKDIAIALALVRLKAGRLDESLIALDTMLNTYPYEENALALWTQIKLDQKADTPFKRIEAAVKRQPDAETLRLRYAQLLAANNHFDSARAEFQTLKSMSPRNGDYLFSLALIAIDTNALDEAETNLKALLALQQRVDEAHYRLGRVMESRGASAAAISEYAKVGPSHEFFNAIQRSGELLLDNNDHDGFSRTFQQARQVSPGQAEQLYMLQAELIKNRGTLEAAIVVFTEAIDLFPKSIPLQYGRAIAWEEIGNIGAMEIDLRAILEQEPDNAAILNALGYTLTIHTERYQEASSLIERALKLSPNAPAILDSLGWVYFKLGRYEQAADLLSKAYVKFPDGEVAAHLGEVLWVIDRNKEARVIFQNAFNHDPKNHHINEAIKRLNILLDHTQ